MKRQFVLCVLWLSAAAFFLHLAISASATPSQAQYAKTKIVMFYVDGLHPANVEEMVQDHKLPHIEDIFYQNGLRFSNMFTIFPSNTVISNGLFMTGKWPDQTGLKSQAMFERFEVPGQVNLEHFVDLVGKRKKYPRYFNLLNQTDVAPRLLKKNGIRSLYDYLGERFHSSVIPISPQSAPTAWPHVAADVAPHFYKVVTETSHDFDRVNGEYAMRYMLMDKRAQLFLIWFPALDEMQHANRSGQFGEVREDLILIDEYIGKIYQGMKNGLEKDERLIAILFSDHGAVGGRDGLFNQPYHIGRDYFYRELKMNVRGPDFSITHPGTDPGTFVFVDNMGRGQAALYFPLRDATSGDWQRPNFFYELKDYSLGPNRPKMDLIRAISEIDLSRRNVLAGKTDPHPVDILIAKISSEIFYLRRFDGSEALILIEGMKKGPRRYRYVPVTSFEQSPDGSIHYEETHHRDPLGYLNDPGFNPPGGRSAFLADYHEESEWLQATPRTEYPDAIVNLVRSLGWGPRVEKAQKSRDPDLVLSAAPGWNFRIEDIEGADHGHLRADSVRITFMMSGPGLRKGTVEDPHHLIELAPTLFQLLNYQGETDFDAEPMDDIDVKTV